MKFAAMAVAAIALCVACEPAENETLDMNLDGKQFCFDYPLGPDYNAPAVIDLGATAARQMYVAADAVSMMGGNPEYLAEGINVGDMVSIFAAELRYSVVPNEDGTSGTITALVHYAGQEPTEDAESFTLTYSEWNGKTIVFDLESFGFEEPVTATVAAKKYVVHAQSIGF